MPPSPSSRRPRGTGLWVESSHKRGHSFESRFSLKTKDDDLVLFNEMQNRERDNFLLHSSDDFDDSISKLRYFSDFKLGITIPAQGESSELLNADNEKNDYDWLLTPPDTPLFPSLDDDEPHPVNVSRGRTRSQPISISRTSMCDKVPKTNRSSTSPCRLSPSPRSSYSVVHSRTRSSSAPCSSPPPLLQPTTPSRRPATPPIKPSPPAQRSLTPTVRRMSTGSSGQAFAGKRGTSPIKTNRGNSASPKLRGWQSNIPGFSTDAPPNLRTSLTDRSASRMRGLSPASGNARGSATKFGRQSISPSGSRSASSSHNSERDHYSSISKPSAASSCEDDAESHASVGVSPNAATRKYGAFANGSRTTVFSKKPSRSPIASSAPKTSFDSAFRQMDHRKAPQNMFRPLLSSVPSTTFYVGKTNSVHRPMFSRNSSLTTSSNASSEHGASVAPDLEDSDHDQSDITGEWEKTKDTEFQEEVFIFDKLNEIREDTGHDANSAKDPEFQEEMSMFGKLNEISEYSGDDVCSTKLQRDNETVDVSMPNKINSKLEYPSGDDGNAVSTAVACQGSYAAECSQVDSAETLNTCLKYGKRFKVADISVDFCDECSATCGLIGSQEPGTIQVATLSNGNDTLSLKVQPQMGMPEPFESRSEVRLSQHEQSNEQGVTDLSMDSGLFLLTSGERDQNLSVQELFISGESEAPESNSKYKSQQSQPTPCLIDRVDNSEGTGIAILLMHRSSSRKWPIMQGTAFSATNLLFSEPSYGRDSMNAMRRSLGRDSSAYSSVDMGSSGQTDGHMLHQLSSTKSEMENARDESHTGAQGCASHSETSSSARETLVPFQIGCEEASCSTVGAVESNAIEDILLDAQKPDHSFGDKNLKALEHTSTEQAVIGIDVSSHPDTFLATSGLLLQSKQQISLQACDTSVANNVVESCDSYEDAGEVFFNNSERTVPEIEAPIANTDSSFIQDNYMLSDAGCQDDISDVATHSSSNVILDQQNDIAGFQDAHNDCTPAQMPNESQDDCISTTSDQDVLISELESKLAEHPSSEEPIVTVEAPRKNVQRSFTLEEATDTILFCSSIVHDMAYKAATIATEKELALYQSSHGTVTFVGSSVSNQKDLRKISNKNIHNSRKVNRKKLETANKMPSVELGNNVKNSEFASCNAEVSHTVDSLKPPKLESKCNCTVM